MPTSLEDIAEKGTINGKPAKILKLPFLAHHEERAANMLIGEHATPCEKMAFRLLNCFAVTSTAC
jgi:hypothetical protein